MRLPTWYGLKNLWNIVTAKQKTADEMRRITDEVMQQMDAEWHREIDPTLRRIRENLAGRRRRRLQNKA